TSHVPVVLLTAKADFDSRLEGLEQGADAYLAKPFEQRELEIVLRKLLQNRENLRRHFTSAEFIARHAASPVSTQSAVSTTPAAKPEALRLNPQDEQFFQRLLATLEAHLDDYELSAEKLAGLVNLSYSALQRKIKTLTGMSVTGYVRHFRLHRAAQMLVEQPERSVTQISLEVGFNNLNFFSREFRKTMGCGAKEWRSRQGSGGA
ncbi:MAG: helix-turn-helix domain-containing protein, partial [Bacteroidota bacterium]